MNTRKRKYTTTILATALLFSLGGCVKDELCDTAASGQRRSGSVNRPAAGRKQGRLYSRD